MSTTLVRGKGSKILLLNPNSSSSMTDGMKAVVNDINLPYSTEVYTYTAPSDSPASIDDDDDIKKSVDTILADLNSDGYDGIVVACFSVHPLVQELHTKSKRDVAVTGIFEASVLTALSLLQRDERWGIITTGKFWEGHLSVGVDAFLGADVSGRGAKFAGVESTGLNASDFHHGVDPAVVREKLKNATKRLLRGKNVSVVVMGCAGMAGLEEIIREATTEEYDDEFAYSRLHVIDGVRAGITQVDHMIRNQRLRPGRKS